MKTNKIIYWVTTSVVSAMMALSAYAYITNPSVAEGFKHFGFPPYFRIELAIAKLIGAMVLLAPVPGRLKEWAYAGFGITFISAFIAHTASGDPVANISGPVILFGVLIWSYVCYTRLKTVLK